MNEEEEKGGHKNEDEKKNHSENIMFTAKGEKKKRGKEKRNRIGQVKG